MNSAWLMVEVCSLVHFVVGFNNVGITLRAELFILVVIEDVNGGLIVHMGREGRVVDT